MTLIIVHAIFRCFVEQFGIVFSARLCFDILLNDPWEVFWIHKRSLGFIRIRADQCLRIATTVFISYVLVEIGFEALLVSGGIVDLFDYLFSRVRPPRLSITWVCGNGNQIVNKSWCEDIVVCSFTRLEDRLWIGKCLPMFFRYICIIRVSFIVFSIT